MDNAQQKRLKAGLAPVARNYGDLLIDAIVMRVQVSLILALENGAEPEDVSRIMDEAVGSGIAIANEAIDKICMKKVAANLTKRK